ncbi:hypothetical protein D3C73_1574720 [compost metagenome]
MDEFGDGRKTEHCPRTLDRMQGPEGGIDQVIIGGVLLEIEEARLELIEQLARLLAECLRRIGNVHAPVTFLITASS